MSNLVPPDYEPELSDIRTRTGPNAINPPSISALARRNASRISRRHEALRPVAEQTRSTARVRRLQTYMRSQGFSPQIPPPNQEPSSKRRKTERYGQVEMEHLPMKFIYYDGGQYQHPGNFYSTEYIPECALKDDSSVYCTRESQCNMILEHTDGQCFSLQRLVIRAPPKDYTSPVRAGMIFVTMDKTDLLSQTKYTMQYESDDEDGDSGDEDSLDRLLDSDCDLPLARDAGRHSPSLVLSRISGASPSSPATASTSAGPSSSLWTNLDEPTISRPPPVDLLLPNATFMHKGRNTKCVINFEPAISGRFILAKFFATHKQRNIDIEFIGAYGWTGRRCFPAVNLR